MVNNKQIAHDLSILYMQAEIKNGQIDTPLDNYELSHSDFLSLYKEHYELFLKCLDD